MQAAERAGECLTGMITAQSRQGSDSLVKLVLADPQVCGDLLGCLSGVKQRGSQDPTLQVDTLTRVAAAVSLLPSNITRSFVTALMQSCLHIGVQNPAEATLACAQMVVLALGLLYTECGVQSCEINVPIAGGSQPSNIDFYGPPSNWVPWSICIAALQGHARFKLSCIAIVWGCCNSKNGCVQVAAGSLLACQMTCKQLLPPLASAASEVLPPTQHQDHKLHETQQQLGLAVILTIVTAAVKTAGADVADQPEQYEGDPMAGTAAAVFEAVTGSRRLQDESSANPGGGGGGATIPGRQSNGDAEMRDSASWMQDNSSQQLAGKMPSPNGVEHTNGGDGSEEDAVQLLQLQVLTELVSFPAASSPLTSQVCCN